jgi:uncharacterized membrane protein YdfJ with MMPL/SSD domain
MAKLADFLARRRWFVLAAWLVVVLASLPLAARQTEHLTSGGFDVPGSQSQIVEQATVKRFGEEASRGRLALVLRPARKASAEQLAAAVERASSEADAAERVSLSPAAPAKRAGSSPRARSRSCRSTRTETRTSWSRVPGSCETTSRPASRSTASPPL